MRPILFSILISLCSFSAFAQNDSVLTPRVPPRTQVLTPANNAPQSSGSTQVLTPANGSPLSTPGTLMQAPINTNVPVQEEGRNKRKTAPPSDPKAFGVAVPLGKTKQDTLKR
ncbi:hypothetical protein [Tellurirhabdus bombi]|uniref:hypothetical protein n=1 Tax=Tellurirhabdus bombi TaxID=2907205 RepID=UPI001F34AB4B|nr:hypothetical protein [Tellurirhabdus bombi]